MRKVLLLLFISFFAISIVSAQKKDKQKRNPNVDYRIDNMGYWMRMAEKGYVSVAPKKEIPKAIYKGSKISSRSSKTTDSPDIMITNEIEQTELSIFVDPSNNNKVLNSNNSGNSGSFYGTSYLITEDGSQNPWGGSVQSAGGSNNGDPATAISLGGRQYVGFIHSNSGQGVAYSDDGVYWTSVVAGTSAGGFYDMLDKNHLWIDNVAGSSYNGNVYDAWTDFGGGGGSGFDNNIGFVRSTDNGVTYSAPINLSSAISAGSHQQGVNLNVGKNGEVYAVWAVYDNGSVLAENAIGFAKSTDGGATFSPATRIIDNIKGIRDAGVSKDMRVTSFPVMATNLQNGEIYVVWANIGFPGINTGTNKSVFFIKSSDNGDTWSAPIRVNQGTNDAGKEAYHPWITCDPETGAISVIYYDDRDVSSTQVETWVSNSFDGGETWEAFRVSDVAFTPSPLPGMASGYMGDYLGISARGGKVYPVWPDNRSGSLYAYCSPYETNNRAKPTDLVASITNQSTGETELTWAYTDAKTLQHFIVYRDGVKLGTTNNLIFTDNLPVYGTYKYNVTAMHNTGESSAAVASVVWGTPNIVVSPSSLSETLLTNQTSVKTITVSNTGELALTYNVATEITSKGNSPKAYCDASGAGNDEFISHVVFGSIDNTSGYTPYTDFTSFSTDVDAGSTYPITIENGTTYSSDDLGVWIDWNQDEDFDDAGENVVCETSNEGQGTYDIIVPDDALGGQTRMRIRIKFSGSDCGSPCGTTSYGEVEDYTINVNSWLKTSNTEGTILPGKTQIIPVTFISTDLAEGTYNATIKINSNDEDEATVSVPVSLEVVGSLALAANPCSEDETVCSGSSTTLHANTVGGSGTYTYSWTSTPAGFTSTDENPVVTPTENTVYHLTANDGTGDVLNDVTVSIYTDLTQADAPTGTETEFCQDGANTLYQTNPVVGANTYDWVLTPSNAGNINVNGTVANINWESDFSGAASLTVAAVNTCGTAIASIPLSITVNSLPNVALASFDDVCIDADAITLSGGSPLGGTYFGDGVNAGDFSPSTAGVGNHTITYTYSDGTCENSAQETIIVNELPEVTLASFSSVHANDAAFTLTGGSPSGGTYSGPGVEGGMFNPSVAGEGTHTITYTYSDGNNCENSAQQTIFVDAAIGIKDIIGNVKLIIYPNPAKDKLYLGVNSSEVLDLDVKIVNQIGMTVLNKEIFVNKNSKTEFDLSQFSSGIYFITINNEKINITRKIIIQ